MKKDEKLFYYIEGNRWLKDQNDEVLGEVSVIHNCENQTFEVDGYLREKRFSFDIDEFESSWYFEIFEDEDGNKEIKILEEPFEDRLKKEIC